MRCVPMREREAQEVEGLREQAAKPHQAARAPREEPVPREARAPREEPVPWEEPVDLTRAPEILAPWSQRIPGTTGAVPAARRSPYAAEAPQRSWPHWLVWH